MYIDSIKAKVLANISLKMIVTQEQSKLIQQALFPLGFRWDSNDYEGHSIIGYPYFFIDVNRHFFFWDDELRVYHSKHYQYYTEFIVNYHWDNSATESALKELKYYE